ncbi:hypothetical protein RQP54_00370 [Curvibacter sp. APW13]|uniref:hypothetical protein n=1 Tax=Curvibacter sp. APW13 TaxID=3077236 RepID=UPI0028DDEDDB|nr:hypothetical protein [Curvibacter sp. APW13]MDT8989308.1 hypothetical protein [Curvibacter sp. APW13]
MLSVRTFLGLLLALCLAWFLWTLTGYPDAMPPSADPHATVVESIGSNTGKGNMLAVQPWLTARDYANADTLERKLATYLQLAQDKGWLHGGKTVVVWPEYTGTWLVAANEKQAALEAPGIVSALTTVALTHLPAYAFRLLTAPAVAAKDRWALFTLKSRSMAADYETVFGNLSRRFGVYMVAGSTVLPSPTLVKGHLVVQPGQPLVAMSAVFAPDGRIQAPLVLKSFPIADELDFAIPARSAQAPLFVTDAGKLAVLICADAWYPASYDLLRGAGATLMAVPSFSAGNGAWSVPWAGYNGAPNAADVDTRDIGTLTEAQAWHKYAMQARAPAIGVHTAANVFLRGQLWDLGSDGGTLTLQRGQPHAAPVVATSAMTNLWIH